MSNLLATPMDEYLHTKQTLAPKQATIDFIRVFARTYRTILSDSKQYGCCIS